MTYPLARDGVFATVQGEGSMLGVPMVFVRLGGCSIGCAKCDTLYLTSRRLSADAIADEAARLAAPLTHRWVWLTGGEPTDHDLGSLIVALKSRGLVVALATAGHKAVADAWGQTGPHYLSVSPHDPAAWVQKRGNELKLVPGLNGYRLADFPLDGIAFGEKFVTPCEGVPETVTECQEWVTTHPGWRMGVQAHKTWGLP